MRGIGRSSPTGLLLLLTLGNCLVESPYAVYLALYAKALGFSPAAWALLNTVMILLVSISLLWLPGLLRRTGARTIMIVTFLFTAACLAAIAAHTRAGVIVGAVLFGVSVTANQTCILTELQKAGTRLGRINSMSTVINGAASVAAPLLAALVVQGPGYAALWYGSVAVTLAQGAACLLLPRQDAPAVPLWHRAAAGGAPADRERRFSLLFRSGFAPLLFGMAVLEPFSYQIFNLYSSLRLSALGLSDSAIGYVTAGAYALYFLSSLGAFFFLDRLNVRLVLAACLTCAALSSASFGLSRAVVPAAAALCCYQLFYGWLHPSKNTRLSRFATPDTLPAFFSYSLSVQSFTSAALGALAGALVGITGMQPLIAGGAFMAAGGGIGTLAAPERMRGAHERPRMPTGEAGSP